MVIDLLSSPVCKNISVFPNPKSELYDSHPVPHRGAFRDRHGRWCGMRWTRAALLTRARPQRTAKSCGPDAPTLASSFAGSFSREATVAKEPGHRGEHEISCKTIAQGRPGQSGGPVVTMLVCFLFRTRGCGCNWHPAFPAPSLLEVVRTTTRVHRAARMRRRI
jgi:hypothetical protein